MHYVREMQAFYERLESPLLSVYAIALWHTLMHMKHKQDWNKEFKAVKTRNEKHTPLPISRRKFQARGPSKPLT